MFEDIYSSMIDQRRFFFENSRVNVARYTLTSFHYEHITT